MRSIPQSSEENCVQRAGACLSSGASYGQAACLLPLPRRNFHWNPQRKAEVLAAVRRGALSLYQACHIYELSLEEFLDWQQKNALYGLGGLRATAPLRGWDTAPVNGPAGAIFLNRPDSVPAENR
jgi:hypothetical protein